MHVSTYKNRSPVKFIAALNGRNDSAPALRGSNALRVDGSFHLRKQPGGVDCSETRADSAFWPRDGCGLHCARMLAGIKVFRQIVESGSFVAASERLEMSTAMVSKHLKHIEKRLGVRLLNRNSRKLSLTEPAESISSAARRSSLPQQTELEHGSLNDTHVARCVLPCRVGLPDDRHSRSFSQALPAVPGDRHRPVARRPLRRHRGGRIRPGVPHHRARRFGDLGPQDFPLGLVARRVHSYRWLIAASRKYLEQHGTPRAPEDLAHHRWVTSGDFDTLPLTGPDGPVEVPVRTAPRSRSLAGVVNAVAAGIGIGLCRTSISAIRHSVTS